MIKIKIQNVAAEFAKLTKSFKEQAMSIADKQTSRLEEELVARTPIDTGEARQGWRKEATSVGFDIINDVEHVKYLNEGSSKQAPSHFIEHTALKYGTPKGAIVEVT